MSTQRLFPFPAPGRWIRQAIVFALLLSSFGSTPTCAQSAQDFVIYGDSLQSGWQDWSWATRNLAQTSPVYSGTKSIEVDFGAYQGLALHHDRFVAGAYENLSFYIHGGATGGQRFNVLALNAAGTQVGSVPVTNYVPGGVIPAGQWVHVLIPLRDLHADTLPDLSAFWLQESTGKAQPPLYVDLITLTAPVPPASTTLTVNAAQTVRTVDRKVFGVNTAIWDGALNSASTKQLMLAAGTAALRFPGGSASDAYDWTKVQYSGQSATPQFADLAGTLGADAFITINYGTGTLQEAAAWVAYCNATPSSTVTLGVDANGRDWKTAAYWAGVRSSAPISPDDGLNFLRVNHPAPYGFHLWEIGNECYGGWENDTHAQRQDGVIYANFAASAAALMKSVDPAIAIGAVVTGSEDDQGNQKETVTNPITGKTHKGWSSVVLSTLAGIGYTPDFVIYHNYAQGAGGESDTLLLHSAATWTLDAAAIRTMLTQYLGGAAAANVTLTSTENNSVSTGPGKQSVSLVNGLYYADSTGSLLQTEFAANVWWDMHNGVGTDGNLSSTLYGWRSYGDYGVLATASSQPGAAQNTPYPQYFGMKLLSKFAQGGDTIVAASSSFTNLSVYAARQKGGALALLVINKDAQNDLPATVTLNGFAAAPTAAVWQYSKTQDTAQSQGNAVDLAQSTVSTGGASLAMTFPSYSMTVIVLPQAVTPTPTLSPAGGLYNAAQSVTLTDTAPGAVMYYTLDGSVPTTTSAVYGGPITVAQSQTVTTLAVAPGSLPSTTAAAAYQIDTVPPVTTATVNGTAVTLSATDTLSGVASTVYSIDGGAQQTYSGPFTVTGAGMHTVSYGSTDAAGNTEAAQSVTVTVPVSVLSLSLTPISVKGGISSTGLVTLSGPAPAGGVKVTQASSDTSAATLAPLLTIPAGASAAKFKITTLLSSATKSVIITSALNGTSQTTTLTVTGTAASVTVQSLTLSPTRVKGGATCTGTITLSGPAPAGGVSIVQTSSDTSAATLAPKLNIPAGAASAKFKITTYAVSATKSVTITSALNGASKSATLTVTH